MRIYPDDSPARDWEREMIEEQKARVRLLDELDREIRETGTALHNLRDSEARLLDGTARLMHDAFPDIDPVALDLQMYGECPECGRPNKRLHGCPAKE